MATRVHEDAEPLPGYRLIERLGRGGYGEVWKAEAPGGLFKAIKFVYGDLESAGDDNKAAAQELKALNRVKTIRHPFLLSIERFDIIDGQLMIVMELADRNLWDRFQECRSQGLPGIPRDELLRYLDESSEALDLMNLQYQIQHLDIKPQNLFLVHNHVKVADFGLAKDLEGIRATVTGGVTPVYAAPETFEGWISHFCDQYSLAIVYQELLTGVRPFSGTNTRQLLLQHISAAPDLSSLPLNEWEVVGRALSKKPDERFASCGEFVRAIHEAHRTSASFNAKAVSAPDPSKTQPNFKPPAVASPTAETKKPDPPTIAQPAHPQVTRPSALRGLPALVTPGAVATLNASRGSVIIDPQTSGAPITLQRPIALDTGHLSRLGVASLERIGQGVLFPVYVVGVGRVGLQVLQRLRSHVHERFGRSNLPHWKWLFIDTDAETVQSAVATDSNRNTNLDLTETYLARMHRPAHYTKREGLPAPESWMSNEILYRIPREPATDGIRCLGRLAFCDHYLGIALKIRQDLETFVSDDALMEADRLTNLGIRSNRPRVYIASSLAGGTGSGMLIDLAYVIRNEMRLLGFVKPQLTGLLLTPPVDRSTPRNLAVANAHTALAELNYFSMPANRYEARFDMRQATLADPDRPFERCMLLTLPRTAATKSPAAARAAGIICQESLTPLGRRMDEARENIEKLRPPTSMPLHSFGCYRISWPRQRLLETSAVRLAALTVSRWCAKDVAPAREAVATWFGEEWRRRQLDAGALAGVLRTTLTASLGETAETLIEDEIRSLPADLSVLADLPDVVGTVDRIFRLVGRPGKDEEPSPGRFHTLLDEVAKPIARESEIKFAKMAVHFVEHPGLRLAAAEEAIRLGTAHLQSQIDEQEKQARVLVEEIADEYRRFAPLLGSLSAGGIHKGVRRGQAASELLALVRTWSKKRLQYLLCRCIASIYRQMLGNAPGYIREIGFCRLQLGEFAATLEKQAVAQADAGTNQDHPIMSVGCKSILESANQLVAKISHDEFRQYEENLQQQIRRQCRALLNVCLAMTEQGPRLQQLLLEQAREFIDARLGHHSSVEELFASRPDEQSVQREILRAYEESSPEPFGPAARRDAQTFILGVASSECGKRFHRIAQELLPGIPITMAASADEIVFYRESHDLSFAELPQAGVLGADAAREVKSRDRIDTHSRKDVPWPT